MRRLLLLLTAALTAWSCGGEEDGQLTLSVNPIPEFTNATTLQVTGTVTRTPAKEAIITVVIAGGRGQVSDSVTGGGAFSLTVELDENAENQLAVSAFDETGATSSSVILAIAHDDIGPQIVRQTPVNMMDAVALDTPIEVEFGEPLTASEPNARLVLLQNFVPVVGTTTLSADARVLTFVPDAPLTPNSVYEMVFPGYTDEFDNPVGGTANACFITTAEGFPNSTELDGTDEGFLTDPPPESSLQPVNLTEARFALAGDVLHGVIRFALERAFADPADNSGLVFIEIDADQDPGTGFTSLKDTIFGRSFEELDSGIMVEYIVGIEPLNSIGGLAYVGVMTEPGTFDVIEPLLPGICGRFYGFHTTTLVPEMGDANFDYTLLAVASGMDGAFFDPAPEAGHYSVALSAPIIPGPRAVRLPRSGVSHKRRSFAPVTRR
jgi:hypothetical protein